MSMKKPLRITRRAYDDLLWADRFLIQCNEIQRLQIENLTLANQLLVDRIKVLELIEEVKEEE